MNAHYVPEHDGGQLAVFRDFERHEWIRNSTVFHLGFVTPAFRAFVRRCFPWRIDTTGTIRPCRRV